jgi:hypothetical protein
MNVPTIFKNVDVVDVVMDTNGRERDKWKYFSSEQKLQRNFFCSFLTSIFELCTIKNSISTKESKFCSTFLFLFVFQIPYTECFATEQRNLPKVCIFLKKNKLKLNSFKIILPLCSNISLLVRSFFILCIFMF